MRSRVDIPDLPVQIFSDTFPTSIARQNFLQCLTLLLLRSAKSMCSRKMGALLDSRPLVAEARERSRVKRRRSHPPPHQYGTWIIAEGIFNSRSFPSREPFDFVADLATLDPKDIFGGIRGLSEARYQRDLSRVFNEAAPTSNEGLAAMHKTWFEVSSPTGVLSCYARTTPRLL